MRGFLFFIFYLTFNIFSITLVVNKMKEYIMDKVFTTKCTNPQLKELRKKLKKLKKETGKSHIFLIIEGLSYLEDKKKVDF